MNEIGAKVSTGVMEMDKEGRLMFLLRLKDKAGHKIERVLARILNVAHTNEHYEVSDTMALFMKDIDNSK